MFSSWIKNDKKNKQFIDNIWQKNNILELDENEK